MNREAGWKPSHLAAPESATNTSKKNKKTNCDEKHPVSHEPTDGLTEKKTQLGGVSLLFQKI